MITEFGPVSLRPMRTQDLALVLAWRNSEAVRPFMTHDGVIAMADHQRWWAKAAERGECRHLIATDALVPKGLVYFNDMDRADASAAMGIYIGAAERRRGLGSIMQWLLLEHAFGPLALKTLRCEVLSNNPRALSLYERFGFRRLETVPAAVRRASGEELDLVRLELTSEDWSRDRARHADGLLRFL